MANTQIVMVAPCCGQDTWLAIAREDGKPVATASGLTRQQAIVVLEQRLARIRPSFNVAAQPVWQI